MENKLKILNRFHFKTKTSGGNLCKTYVWVHEDGTIYINQLFLVDDVQDNPAWKKLYSKFGKTLYVVAVGFKYSSLLAITNTSTQILQSNNVKPQNLL